MGWPLVMLGRAFSHNCSCAGHLNKSLAQFNKRPHWGFLTGMATINLHEFFISSKIDYTELL